MDFETPGQTLGKLHFAGVNVPLLGHHPSGVVFPLYVVFPASVAGIAPVNINFVYLNVVCSGGHGDVNAVMAFVATFLDINFIASSSAA